MAEGADFSNVRTLDAWGGTGYDLPFPSIGAGVRVYHKGTYREILFNKAGTHFVIFPDPIQQEKVYQIGFEEM
ncbi:MAG: hypothetical protein AAFY71_19770 [Bacteroidota bacterium]